MFLVQKHECRKKVWILLHQDFGGQERGEFSLLPKTTFIVNGGFLWVNRENFPVIGSVVEKR